MAAGPGHKDCDYRLAWSAGARDGDSLKREIMALEKPYRAQPASNEG